MPFLSISESNESNLEQTIIYLKKSGLLIPEDLYSMDISIQIKEIPGYFNPLCPFVYDPPYYPDLEISKLFVEKAHNYRSLIKYYKYDYETVWCGGLPYFYKGKLCNSHNNINTILFTTIKRCYDYKKITRIVVTFNKIIEV